MVYQILLNGLRTMNHKNVIYTCLTNSYDSLSSATNQKCDCICFCEEFGESDVARSVLWFPVLNDFRVQPATSRHSPPPPSSSVGNPGRLSGQETIITVFQKVLGPGERYRMMENGIPHRISLRMF